MTNSTTRVPANGEGAQLWNNGNNAILMEEPMIVPRFPRWLWLKSLTDKLAAAVLLVCSVPFLIVSGVVIKLTSPGPVFYRQKRVGLRGEEFLLYKLRTMIPNAEAKSGPVWATVHDTRITPFGAFLRNTHIDELPQLVHVLFAQMSLVGPRPERPEFVNKLQWEFNHYNDRVNVRPGITGLAQILLPPDSTIENVAPKLRYDLYYVRNANPWLDLRILFFTGLHAIGQLFSMAGSLFTLPRIDDASTSSWLDKASRRMSTAHRSSLD